MCTFLFQSGALWDMGQMHCSICEIGPLMQPAAFGHVRWDMSPWRLLMGQLYRWSLALVKLQKRICKTKSNRFHLLTYTCMKCLVGVIRLAGYP